jgi:carbonic anhydrase
MRPVDPFSCSGELVRGPFDRRRFIHLAASAGLAATLPIRLWAAEGDYEAMLLSCIDPRMVSPVYRYMEDKRRLGGKYSQFVIAGAAIAVVAPKFKNWRPAFWDNLATSVQLHHIKKVIAIDHRDCGAAKIAYGDDSIADPQIETRTHRAVMAEFRAGVARHYPQLAVETGLMALDGSIEMFT